MDLDGTWGDQDLDGMFDSHTANEQPEIFIGRLSASTLAGSNGTELSMIDNYFRKVHDWRHGRLSAHDRALSFRDDDWVHMDTGEKYAYRNLIKDTDPATTTGPNYLARLTEGYSSVVVCAHSNTNSHRFIGASSIPSYVHFTDIWALDPPCLFYNLFACYASRHTHFQYLAGAYLFNPTGGLIVVGSTKSGGMQFFDDYHAALGGKACFGEAYKTWFANRHPYTLSDRRWFYGMVLLGDPTLKTGVGLDLSAYGTGCPGSSSGSTVTTILPRSFANQYGNRNSYNILGSSNHRYQQVFAANEVPTSFTAGAIAFRQDDLAARSEPNYWAELAISLGYCPNSPSNLSTTFSANAQNMTNVVQKKQISLPYWTTVNTSPANFLIKIPFDTPFSYTAQAGRYLILDAVKTNSSIGDSSSFLYLDSISQTSPLAVSRVVSYDPNSTTGYATAGMGLVVGFVPSTGSNVIPSLTTSNTSGLGRVLELQVHMARSNTPIGLGIGLSDSSWGGFGLPLDLTPLGATGCSILASQDLLLTGMTDSNGICLIPITLPMNIALHKSTLFFQAIVVDPPANQAGLATTNGLKLVIDS